MQVAVIFDIDGTLANINHRLHHVKEKPKNWDRFFAECINDIPVQPICALQRILNNHYRMIIVSGRGEDIRPQTEARLEANHISYDLLLMRPNKDYRPDDIIKEEILDSLLNSGENITFVVEDRQRIVDMWRRRGLTCLQVAAWEEP